MDRVAPIRKGTRVFIGDQLENKTITQLEGIAQKVTTMMAEGIISAEEASAICTVLKYRKEFIESHVLEAKIYDMQKQLDTYKKP